MVIHKLEMLVASAMAAMVIFVAANGAVAAADIKVMSSGAYRAALEELISMFEKATANKIVPQYDPSAVVAKKIDAGEAFDVAISSDEAIHSLVLKGIVLTETATVVGVNAVSLAYRKGSQKPDISSPEALKLVLLGAKSISFSDPAKGGSSANYFERLIKRLGIADEVHQKAILTKPGEGAFPVGEGRAEIGVAQTSEIVMAKGVEGIPLMPSDGKSKSVYAAGISSQSSQAEASRVFLKFMQSPEAIEVRKANGLAIE